MSHLEDTAASFAELNMNIENLEPMSDVDDAHDSGLRLPAQPCAYPKNMPLDVGGRKFKVARDVLMESGLFRHQLDDRFTWTQEPDGSYFLDADPDLFEHVLRFMRRPDRFPLFYTSANGIDYDLYSRLEDGAEYFQLDTLRTWIKQKKYLQAVKVIHGSPVTRKLNDIEYDTTSLNESIERHIVPRTTKIYICPRSIPVHRGNPEKCGLACRKAQGENEVEYEDEPYLEVVSIRKEIIFDDQACRAG